jgi:serine/threonine protein kinase
MLFQGGVEHYTQVLSESKIITLCLINPLSSCGFRYVPLSRLQIALDDEGYTPRCSFPSVSSCKEIEVTASSTVYHCKIGAVDAAAKIRYLDTRSASNDEVKLFEYKLLGEVRMLGALRKQRSIVDIYGHQLSSKWVQVDGDKEYRILQSIILMEYVNGGSLKVNHLSCL